VALLVFTVLTESATTERAPAPDVGADPGRLETRSSSSSVAPGASLKPKEPSAPRARSTARDLFE
jgi:hypothetical protein